MSTLEIKNLNFSYKDKVILKDINLNLCQGEFVSILGKNGAGKTTLFKNILGILKRNSGQILVQGQPIENLNNNQRAKLLAYIPQESKHVYNFSVLTCVLMGRTPNLGGFSTPQKDDYDKALEALEYFGILNLKDKMINELSGGERQLVRCARALVQDAKILIFDEPTSNLDWANQIMILSTIKKLTEKGYLALVSTHNLEQALNYSTRIVLMKDNKILKDGTPKALSSSNAFDTLYNQPIKIIQTSNHYFCMPKDEQDVVE